MSIDVLPVDVNTTVHIALNIDLDLDNVVLSLHFLDDVDRLLVVAKLLLRIFFKGYELPLELITQLHIIAGFPRRRVTFIFLLLDDKSERLMQVGK